MNQDKNKKINEYLLQIQRTRKIEYVESLYDLIAPTIRHIALKYMHDKLLADDLVQDFWADIYKISDGYILFGNAHAYLCKVSTNRAINRYKKLKLEKARVMYVDYSDERFSSGSESMEQIDIRLSVEQAMKQLDEVERIIIQSAYFEQKTVRQIAAELKMSKSKVGRLKIGALEKLRSFFGQENYAEKGDGLNE